MLIEILAKIDGNFTLEPSTDVKINPYLINVIFDEAKQEYYISVKKKIYDFLEYLPKMAKKPSGVTEFILPSDDLFDDVIQIMQHIESFGALDKNIQKIHWETPTITWIPEQENEKHLAPLSSYSRKLEYNNSPRLLTQDWLYNTVLHRRQLSDLYVPFSFFREGANLYHQHRYQSSFCSFYMMLEYFFHDQKKGYGIRSNAHLTHIALNTALKKSLNRISLISHHYDWIFNELKKGKKEYDEEGLIFLLNKYRDNFSHAAEKDKNRNILNERHFSTLAFLAMIICLSAAIKMRLLPFVKRDEINEFLKK